MEKTVTLTQSQVAELYRRWDQNLAELGASDDDSPEARAEYFFHLAQVF